LALCDLDLFDFGIRVSFDTTNAAANKRSEEIGWK